MLFDTYKDNAYGGTGESFDHSIIPDINHKYFLAGGIGINNIKEKIINTNAYCIDVSSSVETDGVKDYDKIKNIIAIVRGF